jgi:hypothetical protein
VSRFLDDAVSVFETASGGGEAAEIAILLDTAGAVRIVPAEGWQPEALQAHYGAEAVYHVSRTADGVRVRGRSGEMRCAFQSQTGPSRLNLLARSAPLYTVVPACPELTG